LHFDPANLANSVLNDSDWTKILGKDPLKYDYTGIDPHMIEDFTPRSGIPGPGTANSADPINGHDWTTNTSNGVAGNGLPGSHILSVDREYACIFPLANPRDCTLPQNANFCDCPHANGGLTSGELPPLCNQSTPTQQVAAKAYPTIRELLLAKLMGNQGIVSSLCPIHPVDMGNGDPLYGYRPAVAVIVDRLKNALTAQCLPQSLQQDPKTLEVPCLILLQLTQQKGSSCTNPDCTMSPGLKVPNQDVLNKFCAGLEADFQQQVSNNGGSTTGLTDPATIPVCELNQLTPSSNPGAFQAGSCANASAMTDQGWCYVTGTPAGKCPQAILFTPSALPSGALSNLQCIEQSVSVLGGGGTQGTSVGSSSSSGGGGGG
jgi:hypothetical protein